LASLQAKQNMKVIVPRTLMGESVAGTESSWTM
jgi:hypothetical protein